MTGVREEVEWLHLEQAIAAFRKLLQVANLRRRIAGHIDDARGVEGDELFEKLRRAAFAWRVDDDRSFVLGKIDFREDRFGRCGHEVGIADAIGRGVVACPLA